MVKRNNIMIDFFIHNMTPQKYVLLTLFSFSIHMISLELLKYKTKKAIYSLSHWKESNWLSLILIHSLWFFAIPIIILIVFLAFVLYKKNEIDEILDK